MTSNVIIKVPNLELGDEALPTINTRRVGKENIESGTIAPIKLFSMINLLKKTTKNEAAKITINKNLTLECLLMLFTGKLEPEKYAAFMFVPF